MKQYLKRRLNESDYFFILVNLLAVWGVWFGDWNATEVFLVYCLESVIIGLFNVVRLLMTTLVKGKDEWQANGAIRLVSGFFFIAFFIAHYGLFLFVQTSIFLATANLEGLRAAPKDFFDFIFHFPKFLSENATWLLLTFVISYAFQTLKNFVFNGAYRTASLSMVMFQPYMRVFVQQFAVILGAIFLLFGAGKIFILIFAIVKTFFEVMMDYDRVIEDGVKKSMEAKKLEEINTK